MPNQLDPDAKVLISEEVKRLLAQYESLYRELEVYRYVIRALFILILGGSIYGVLKFESYVDTRIGGRVERLDRLDNALSNAYTENWGSALYSLDALWSDIEDKRIVVGDEFKNFLYLNLLRVLANIPDENENEAWTGSEQWVRLRKDKYFIREFWQAGIRLKDSAIQSNLGLAILKFEPNDAAIDRAQAFFMKALSQEESMLVKADLYFRLSLIAAVKGDLNRAIKLLTKASDIDPENYLLEDWVRYGASFKNSSEYSMWTGVAKQYGKNMDVLFLGLINAALATRPDTAGIRSE